MGGHLAILGGFRADNGLDYFDLSDFDEAALAHPTRSWDDS